MIKQHGSSLGCSCLTLIQSMPLVYRGTDGKLHPLDATGNEEEEVAIEQALEAATVMGYPGIGLKFCAGTTDGLTETLGANKCQAIHISCHGRKEYLALEHRGALQAFLAEELKRLVGTVAKTGKIQQIFLSACDSFAAGKGLVEAGIPHVVCCEGSVRDDAAIVFARNLYRAQACGNTLQVAFDLAREALSVSMEVKNAKMEAKKFRLLPENNDAHHDVQIFCTSTTKQVPQKPLVKRHSLPRVPTSLFLGRKVEMHQIVDALRPGELSPRIIQITGPQGTGKLSLALATCRHISKWYSTQLMIDDVFLLPSKNCSGNDSDDALSKKLHESCASLLEQRPEENNREVSARSKENYNSVVTDLHDARALLVIDAKQVTSKRGMDKLMSFVDELCGGTRYVRVIIVCATDTDVSSKSTRSKTMTVDVGPLDFKSSVMLFGNYCKFVTQGSLPCVRNPRDLATILVPHQHQGLTVNDKKISPRFLRNLSLIGGGNPKATQQAAVDISRKDFVQLVQEGYPVLQAKIFYIENEIHRTEDSNTKHELQNRLKELQDLLNRLPSLDEIATDENEESPSESLEDNVETPNQRVQRETSSKQICEEAQSTGLSFARQEKLSEHDDVGIVGIEFSGTNMDNCDSWNDFVLESKFHIEDMLQSLQSYGEVCEGEPKLTAQRVSRGGKERVAVRLRCAIDVRKDLEAYEYKRVKEICRKLARLLKMAGATDEELEDLMIGTAWRGSLVIFMEAPSIVFEKFFSVFTKETKPIQLGIHGATVVSIAPAFTFSRMQGFIQRSDHRNTADAITWRRRDLTLLIPTSSGAFHRIVSGGIRFGAEDSDGDWQALPKVLPVGDASLPILEKVGALFGSIPIREIVFQKIKESLKNSVEGARNNCFPSSGIAATQTNATATPGHSGKHTVRRTGHDVSDTGDSHHKDEESSSIEDVHQSETVTDPAGSRIVEMGFAGVCAEEDNRQNKRGGRFRRILWMMIAVAGALAVVLGVSLGDGRRADETTSDIPPMQQNPSPTMSPSSSPSVAPIVTVPPTSHPIANEPQIRTATISPTPTPSLLTYGATTMPSSEVTVERTLDPGGQHTSDSIFPRDFTIQTASLVSNATITISSGGTASRTYGFVPLCVLTLLAWNLF